MAVEEGVDEYTQDGTVDLKGNPVLRSKRGGWTACSFVVGITLSLYIYIYICFSLLHGHRLQTTAFQRHYKTASENL
ncbi:hypothetical protein FEM48_Zijuj07G0096000 [Ziziphus jujuba var. spinosa]|uniref:Uncharacterized protein n=1 Tax=Ziziphus jujuba var. spinosa TaxID=714518 RepID=A0A978V3W0_ZIZJJ|nr:hypothetical protein FEM48_Zijuj07G0096000 [Ziziphus jujuba var. spinosa]